MASLVWRKDRGRWYAFFYRADTGRQTGRPLKDAPRHEKLSKRERALAMAEAEAVEEEFAVVETELIDLETAATYWLENAQVTTGPRTVERYAVVVKAFLAVVAPGGKRVPLRDLSPTTIRTFRDGRLKTHQASTVINDLKCLSSMFNWIRKQRDGGVRWIAENPCEDVEHPKRQPRKVVFPSTKEVKRLTRLLQKKGAEDIFRALGILGAYAGMRRMEIIKLRWECVDFESRTLIVIGKSKHPRPVPMHPHVERVLRSLKREGVNVFPSPRAGGDAEKARSATMGRRFNAWLKSNGFGFTHHGLRRWFNDQLRQSPQLSASARLLIVGHEDEAVNRLYQNPQAEEARPFVEALGR